MIRALCLLSVLALGGCGLAPAVILSGITAGFTIAKDVLEIDVAWHQTTPGKTPISAVVPVVPELLP